MNKQISRRNLIKLLGISGASIPLTGLINSKEINLNKNSKESIPIKLSSNENPYGPSEKVRDAIVSAFDEVCRYPYSCLLYTSPSPRDGLLSRMPSSA